MSRHVSMPASFKEYEGEAIGRNVDLSISYKTAEAIWNKPLFSRYAAKEFEGKVWWNAELRYWCMEIWVSERHEATFLSEALIDLINNANQEFGNRKVMMIEGPSPHN
jgi:hypothetical protein